MHSAVGRKRVTLSVVRGPAAGGRLQTPLTFCNLCRVFTLGKPHLPNLYTRPMEYSMLCADPLIGKKAEEAEEAAWGKP